MKQATKDYAKFKPHPAQRDVEESLIRSHVESLRQDGWYKSQPMVVDEQMQIIDGQHRWEAAKRLGIEIPWEMEVGGDPIKKMIAMNAHQQPWKIKDFVVSYSKQNKDCYRKLLKFEEKYQLGITNSIDLFLKDNVKANTMLRQGKEFAVNPDAEEVANYLLSLDHAQFYKTPKFVRAIAQMFKKVGQKDRDHIQKNILKVEYSHSSKDYLVQFENLINGKKQKGRVSLAS